MGKLTEIYKALALDFYRKVKLSCDKCNNEGIIHTSSQTFIDCDCTKIFLKCKEFIKRGISINYLLGGYKEELSLFNDDDKHRISKLIKYIMKLNDTTPNGNICISSNINNSECVSLICNKIGKFLVELEKSVILIKGTDLSKAFCNYETCEELITELSNYKYVIIDSFPLVYNKYFMDKASYSHNQLMMFLTTRQSSGFVTVISFDCKIEKLKDVYSDEFITYIAKNYLHCVVSPLSQKKTPYKKVAENNPELSSVFNDVKIDKEQTTKSTKINNRGRHII